MKVTPRLMCNQRKSWIFDNFEMWSHKFISHINIFLNVKPYKNPHLVQMQFIQDLVLIIAKGYMPLFVVESLGWGRWCFLSMVKYNFLFKNSLFVNIFMLCYTSWKCMCFLPLVGCNYDNNFWPIDVKVRLWHFFFGCQLHQPRLGYLSNNNWIV
jgi:hypothetical protein